MRVTASTKKKKGKRNGGGGGKPSAATLQNATNESAAVLSFVQPQKNGNELKKKKERRRGATFLRPCREPSRQHNKVERQTTEAKMCYRATPQPWLAELSALPSSHHAHTHPTLRLRMSACGVNWRSTSLWSAGVRCLLLTRHSRAPSTKEKKSTLPPCMRGASRSRPHPSVKQIKNWSFDIHWALLVHLHQAPHTSP